MWLDFFLVLSCSNLLSTFWFSFSCLLYHPLAQIPKGICDLPIDRPLTNTVKTGVIVWNESRDITVLTIHSSLILKFRTHSAPECCGSTLRWSFVTRGWRDEFTVHTG